MCETQSDHSVPFIVHEYNGIALLTTQDYVNNDK